MEHLTKRADNIPPLGFVSVRELKEMEKILATPSLPLVSNIYFVEDGSSTFWSTKQKGKVLFKTKVEDLQRIIDTGKKTIAEKNYWVVDADTRPVSDGHPKDWLYFMRNVEDGYMLRDFDKKLENLFPFEIDESWL